MKYSIKRVTVFIFVASALTSVGCSTTSIDLEEHKTTLRQEIVDRSPHSIHIKIIDENEIRKKITVFREVLRKRSKLSTADWALHDELLATYIYLKEPAVQNTKIRIPERSHLKVSLPSFCLNSSRASPSEKETFTWKKKDPEIPYYKELIKIASQDKSGQDDVQTLLWCPVRARSTVKA